MTCTLLVTSKKVLRKFEHPVTKDKLFSDSGTHKYSLRVRHTNKWRIFKILQSLMVLYACASLLLTSGFVS